MLFFPTLMGVIVLITSMAGTFSHDFRHSILYRMESMVVVVLYKDQNQFYERHMQLTVNSGIRSKTPTCGLSLDENHSGLIGSAFNWFCFILIFIVIICGVVL